MLGNSASAELEKTVIDKLREAEGAEYTRNLEAMCKDKAECASYSKQFAETEDGKKACVPEAGFLAVCDYRWPVKLRHNMQAMPQEIQSTCDAFAAFYKNMEGSASDANKKFPNWHKKLTWCPEFSYGELACTMLDKRTKVLTTYTLQASAHQIAVLLIFNDVAQISFDQILEVTGSADSRDYMEKVMATLTKTKLIRQKENFFKVADSVSFKTDVVNINAPIRVSSSDKDDDLATDKDAMKEIEREREPVIHAAIARSAKHSKLIAHKDLVARVGELTAKYFVAEARQISRGIEEMISKSIIKRKEGLRDTYEYIPA